MRYQTAPRPEGFSAAPRSRYVGSSYAEAGDRDRTGDGSLEGSSVTNYTTPARRPIIGSVQPPSCGLIQLLRQDGPHRPQPCRRAPAVAVGADDLAFLHLSEYALPVEVR